MIGERLKQLRKERGLTQKQLAKELGISASTIGMYEQGRREPDHRLLSKICRFFSVSSDFFIEENGNRLPSSQTSASSGLSSSQNLEEIFDDIQQKLSQQNGLMFNGMPLTPQDIERVMEAIRIGTSIVMMEQQKKTKKSSSEK